MIRPALPSDAPALADLLTHYITQTTITFNPVPKTAEDIARMIDEKAAAGHGFFVAVKDKTLLGQASYGQFRAGAGYATCMEHSIVLTPRHTTKGVGRALMAAVEAHAKAAGAHQMIAGVTAENPNGRAFHEKLGYRLIATVPEAGFKFGRFIDLWLMQKFL